MIAVKVCSFSFLLQSRITGLLALAQLDLASRTVRPCLELPLQWASTPSGCTSVSSHSIVEFSCVPRDNATLPPIMSALPANQEEVIARGYPSPSLTQEDVRQFHYHTQIHYFNQELYDGENPSKPLDKKWFRMVSSHDLWAVERPLRGIVYSLGTLIGDWCSHILVCTHSFFNISSSVNLLLYPSSPIHTLISIRYRPLQSR